MHVLLITSEDLNEKNTFASIFELAQAQALQGKGLKVAILSVGYYSTVTILKTFISRFDLGGYNYYRLDNFGGLQLAVEAFRSLYNSALQRTKVRKLKLQEVTVYEALFNEVHFSLNERGHKKWVKHGYKGYLEYVKDHGTPDVIHAHSRFLLAGLLAKEIKDKNNLPYVLTIHSSYYKRNLVKDFQVPMIKQTVKASAKAIAVSSSLSRDANKKLNSEYPYEIVPNVLSRLFDEVELKVNKSDVVTFLNIARLDKNKNQQLLIRAFAEVASVIPESVLVIGGDGPELNSLRDLVQKKRIDRQSLFLRTFNSGAGDQ